MARTLDRSKPYGDIFGFDPEGRRFEQDGAYFDWAGDEIGSVDGAAAMDAAAADDTTPAAPRIRRRASAPPGASRVDDQLAQ